MLKAFSNSFYSSFYLTVSIEIYEISTVLLLLSVHPIMDFCFKYIFIIWKESLNLESQILAARSQAIPSSLLKCHC